MMTDLNLKYQTNSLKNLEIDIPEECLRTSIKTSYKNTKDMYVRNIQSKTWHIIALHETGSFTILAL